MKFVQFTEAGNEARHSGFIKDDQIFRLESGEPLIELLKNKTLESAAASAFASGNSVALSAVQIESPIGKPPSVRDFMAFETHVVTSMSALGRTVDPVWYEIPVFYFSNPEAVTGPYSDITISPGSSSFDFELEIAAIIGTAGSNIRVEDAEKHIAGFAILCDWSARDLQEQEMKVGLGPAKAKDSATSIGPYFLTPDELEPLRKDKGFDIQLSVKVNGKQYSSANWSTIYWSFAQMISFASRGTTLVPGDVIGSGTVGTGCILELGRVHGFDKFPYLKAGDIVEIDGGVLGFMKNKILPAPAVNPI